MVDDKANNLFEKYLERVDPEIRNEVSLNIDIANRIYDLIKKKGMTQREFAALMGKRESEVSRWLSGTHGFTTNTLAKISAVLGEPVVKVPEASEQSMVSYSAFLYVCPADARDGKYTFKAEKRSGKYEYKN